MRCFGPRCALGIASHAAGWSTWMAQHRRRWMPRSYQTYLTWCGIGGSSAIRRTHIMRLYHFYLAGGQLLQQNAEGSLRLHHPAITALERELLTDPLAMQGLNATFEVGDAATGALFTVRKGWGECGRGPCRGC